jgi:hypothetical protein
VTDILDGFPEFLWHIPGQGKGAVGTCEQCVLNTAHVTGSVLPQGLLQSIGQTANLAATT